MVRYADGRVDAVVLCRGGNVGIAYRNAKSWVVVPEDILDCILDSLVSGVRHESDDVVYYANGRNTELFYFKNAGKIFLVTASNRVVDLGGPRGALEAARRLGLGEVEELLKAVL